MILGYCLFGPDDDNYLIDENSTLDLCQNCGFLKDFHYHNPSYKVKRKMYDFFHPYDLGHLVSQRFREFCVRENYNAIQFKELERSFGYYQFFSESVVSFDAHRTGTEFDKLCTVCGNYEETTGIKPPYLSHIEHPLDDGFYRTDIVFGSKNSKDSIIIVGPETHRKLKREKMKGITYIPIER